MKSQFSLKVVEEYLRLSNEGKLEIIEGLLDGSISYHSSAVGAFEDKDNVMQMMRAFFEKFHQPQWSWESLDWLEDEDCVAFRFKMTATGLDGERNGLEKIWVNDSGKIIKVVVEV